MLYQYDSEDHEQKATALLAELGKFVVSFERVCEGMRMCVLCAFRREGLTNLSLCQVVIQGLAAAALREILGAVFSELRDQDSDDRACVSLLLSRIQKLAQVRNSFLHSAWHLNYDYEHASEEFFALALKLSVSQTDGACALPSSVSREILADHIHEATEIQVLLQRLALSLNQKGFKVSENFKNL